LVENRQRGQGGLTVIVSLLKLGRGTSPKGASRRLPLYHAIPLERRELDVLEPLPRSTTMNLLGLEQADYWS
jgi:hypothetical protein